MAQEKPTIALIGAMGAKTRAIGRNGELLWRLPQDLARFKAITDGRPVIMGRKTWESLPPRFRPLPGRTNIVVSREEGYVAFEATVASSLTEALAIAHDSKGGSWAFVIGGGELYTTALPYADCIYLTIVEDDAEGDAFFPIFEEDFVEDIREDHPEATPPFSYVTYRRKS